jgi:hypothetical protein
MISLNLAAALIGALTPELICIVRLTGKKIAVAMLAEIVERAIFKELSKSDKNTARGKGR